MRKLYRGIRTSFPAAASRAVLPQAAIRVLRGWNPPSRHPCHGGLRRHAPRSTRLQSARHRISWQSAAPGQRCHRAYRDGPATGPVREKRFEGDTLDGRSAICSGLIGQSGNCGLGETEWLRRGQASSPSTEASGKEKEHHSPSIGRFVHVALSARLARVVGRYSVDHGSACAP
jgi:hypothetical protein